jgi:hypothetical protein
VSPAQCASLSDYFLYRLITQELELKHLSEDNSMKFLALSLGKMMYVYNCMLLLCMLMFEAVALSCMHIMPYITRALGLFANIFSQDVPCVYNAHCNNGNWVR